MVTISDVLRKGNIDTELEFAKAAVAYWRNETKVRSMERRSYEWTQTKLQEACADLVALEDVAALLNA